MTRAVIYARYSSDLQSDASTEDQLRSCRALAQRQGWEVIGTHEDRAQSGATMLRPGLQRLLEDARARRFDVLLAEALDRLSRDQEDVAGLFKRLRFAGVAIHTVSEGEIGELHVGLKGTMNALFLKDLAIKTRRGLRGRVEEGRSAGGRCYGYRIVQEHDARGERIRGGRTIEETEAETVRRIFRDYVAGRSPRAIALTLNAESIPGPDGGSWSQSTINGSTARGTGILNNELYIGRLIWNRLRYVKDPATGKRVSRLNPPSDHVVQDVPELRIVPQDLWDAVHARRAGQKRDTRPDRAERPFWDQRRPRYLFSGKMRCGACGGPYTKISRELFGCTTAREKGTCDNRLNIRTDTLEATVLDGLRDQLMEPELFQAFATEFHAEVNRARMEQGAERQAAEQEAQRIEQRLKRIVAAIGDGASGRIFQAEITALEARQDELARQLAAPAPPPVLLHPNLPELYRRKVIELQDLLRDEETRAEAFDAIRSLVEVIRLVPENGTLTLELEGDLARMLWLCGAQKQTAAASDRDGRLLEQVKLVAGTGFEPVTFRL